MIYTPFIWRLVFAILINGGLAVYARRFRSVPAALSFSLLMVLGSLTALVYALKISAASLPLRIFWSELRFIPLAPAAPGLALPDPGYNHSAVIDQPLPPIVPPSFLSG